MTRQKANSLPRVEMKPEIEGTWAEDDIRRAFVTGAKWWEFHSTGATMWPSDRNLAEEEADRRYPEGKVKTLEDSPFSSV